MVIITRQQMGYILNSYNRGTPLWVIAQIYDVPVHKVIDIIFWFKVASKRIKGK